MSELRVCKNRSELLGDRLKTRFFDFIWLSLLTFVFIIPLLVWIIYCNYVLVAQITNENYLLMSLLIYLPYIPLGMVFGLGIGGALYYCKRLAWGEGANVTSDLFYGLRKNIKSSLLSFFLLFFFYSLLKIGSLLVSFSFESVYAGIVMGVLYVAFFLIFMIISFTLTQSIIYTGKYTQLMSNSVKFTFGMFGWNLLFFFIILFPFLVYEFVPFAIAQYIALAVTLLFYLGFSLFLFTIYSHSIFDLTINQDYPEIYRKGLEKDQE